ncbi:hypothetical protein [Pseudomonas sp. Irchel 3E13]|uniref:hypothetical protein n=1 Tax=Pseudomonas sp. Irchel 3E13 TaxID=2008975 RepID=UPI000BA2DACF|nr:hypothetical protein [Pseudomonas sp. Irchel 3E13]
MSADKTSSLARVIYESYVNEVCLDQALKQKFLGDEKVADALPQYKIMPLFSLWKRYGNTFLLVLWAIRIALLPLLAVAALCNLFLAVRALFSSKSKAVADLPELICLPNSSHVKLFNYLFDDFAQRISFRCKRPWSMLPYLSALDYVRAVFIVWRVLATILLHRAHRGVRRRDLIFHAVDILPLTWFSLFVANMSRAEKALITDCNLQRWDYIATHLSRRCSIIQHAYIHGDLEFTYSFGAVDCLYVFDQEFEAVFSRYYEFRRSAIIRPKFNLQSVGEGRPVLFLASSAPYVQFEIDFLQRVKNNLDFFIVVKLHPRHVYEASATQLTGLADKVLDAACFPECAYMVSYDSFLGYEYKALGKKVVFLKDEDSVEQFMECP